MAGYDDTNESIAASPPTLPKMETTAKTRANLAKDADRDCEFDCDDVARLCRDYDRLLTRVAALDAAVKAERERCWCIAKAHLARIPNHNPDIPRDDLLAQGYGNAALNIAAEIERGQ